MKILKPILLIFVLGVAAAVGGYYWLNDYYRSPTNFLGNGYAIIEKGAGIGKAAHELNEAGIIEYPEIFTQIAKYYKKTNPKFGEYQFTPDLSPEQILNKVEKGDTVVRKVFVSEGKSVLEVYDILRSSPKLKITLTETDLPAEGTLMPSTYIYHYGDTDKDVIVQMQHNMQAAIDELWPKRAPNLPFTTKQQAITLASIVEKETGSDTERPIVASVFINRLNKGMKLESDPTAVYGITKGVSLGHMPGSQEVRDNNPYNTYLIAALPPGPICNPGKAAIEAVLNPAKTDYLYFVATGSGGHNFAPDYKTHAQNVQKLRDYLKSQKN